MIKEHTCILSPSTAALHYANDVTLVCRVCREVLKAAEVYGQV